jgi:hypothetical protein
MSHGSHYKGITSHTPNIPKNLSLMDCVEKCGDNDDLDEMDMFMSTLHGRPKYALRFS